MTERFHELDTVVLLRDLPEAGLRSGDLGAVVLAYGDEALEVEFVTASGHPSHSRRGITRKWSVAPMDADGARLICNVSQTGNQQCSDQRSC